MDWTKELFLPLNVGSSAPKSVVQVEQAFILGGGHVSIPYSRLNDDKIKGTLGVE